MNIDIKEGSRLARIVEKLLANAKLVEDTDKGSVEIHYSGKTETLTFKVVV